MKRLVFLRQFTLAALLSLLIFSCTKELSPIGMDLLDPSDMLSLGYTDTVQITAYSIRDDSVSTHNLTATQIGSMYDPIFGRTTANFFTQIFLTKSRTRFGTSPVFDSAYLYLPYKAAYGDTLSNMTFRVYALTEDIVDSLKYYSNNTVDYDQSNLLGEITFQPKPYDSTYYGGAMQAPMLRIPISSYFGNYIMNISDTTLLNNNTEFIKKFKGICIIAEPQNTSGKGAIITFNMPSDYSRISMYYHNTEDTTSYNFAITTSCSRFQNYDHNGYAEAIPMLQQQILEHNTSLGQQFLFAQGMGGVKIKIEFPYLNKWFDTEKIVVNDAQLILGNASVSDLFTKPANMTLRGVGEAGSSSPYSLIDDDGSGSFDGYYKASSNSYRFRITRYLQEVLSGKANSNGLHLMVPYSSYLGSRLVLNGTSSPQSDLKLYVRFTRIK